MSLIENFPQKRPCTVMAELPVKIHRKLGSFGGKFYGDLSDPALDEDYNPIARLHNEMCGIAILNEYWKETLSAIKEQIFLSVPPNFFISSKCEE